MSIKKTMDVCAPVLTRARQVYREAKTDASGRIVMMDGTAKRADQVTSADDIAMQDVPIGRLLTMALDKSDDKMSAEERRKRFILSARVEDAMIDGTPFEMEPEDRKRIEAAADLITTNHLFLYRIHEALELAEPVAAKKKANGVTDHAEEQATAQA